LILVLSPVTSASPNGIRARFNGDTGSNYSFVEMYGDGSSAVSGSGTTDGALLGFYTSQSGTNILVSVMDYSATDKHKTSLSRANDAANRAMATATRWANTAAITSVNLYSTNTSFQSGSTFSLYGIAS
jgi:hypothetical protein